ncbi:Uncharacterized protein OS=Isosphaera pallida (strain ATCC 43644 / DSM 9630 / IS1B) GN=Isop_2425 PE=4 SV=1 [Gemmataceae bacterium]|nr:Uncharacterized protein OS=Isosphaera pallida (strain ATCC 43644 / DSM 9630 / IS1B) GN=Isop_2425 PE=4 SV=1 [Gemmataceae bacterium]VTT97952.1 Uncharacterized protein OS=Isosphaera pallida (strain ATCC 43644 / DSM 9630 / IS1B) GN=Isop_2425 PE=4 SV=1 [Gemmataceae bacterium]
MSAKQVRAGRAFVELFATDNMLTRTLDRAAAKVKAFAGTIGGIGLKAGAAGGAILAPLGKALFDAMGQAGEIKRIALQYGQTTQAVSELAGAFAVAGSDTAEFSSTLDGLAGKVRAAADAGGLLDEQLVSLGRARDFEKLSLPKQFDAIAAALGRIPDAAHRAAKAQEWFGAAGAKLLPFLKDGTAGLAKLKAEADRSGSIFSTEEINRSYDATRALNMVWLELKNTIVAVGAALLPTSDQTKDVTVRIREAFAAGRRWVAENKNLIIAAAAGGAALVGLGVTLGVIKVALVAAATGVGAIGAAFSLILSPIGLFTAAVGGFVALFATQTKAGREMCARIGAGFMEFAGTAKSAWGGIVAALKSGDLEGAFEIAGAALELEWEKVMAYWTEQWAKFRDGFLADLGKLAERAQGTLVWQTGVEAKGMIEGGMDMLVDSLSGWAKEAAPVLDMMGESVREIEATAATHRAAPSPALAAPAPEKGPDPDVAARLKRVAEAQERLNALVARAKGPAPGAADAGGGGGDFDGESGGAGRGAFGAIGKLGVGLQGLKEKIAAGALTAQQLGNRQKGIFSGPVAQTLAVGDSMAKRQYDAQKEIAAAAKMMVKEQAGIREDNKKVLGLLKWH